MLERVGLVGAGGGLVGAGGGLRVPVQQGPTWAGGYFGRRAA